LELIEDAANRSVFFTRAATRQHGRFGVLSFNGNKIVTTGGAEP